MRDFSRRLSKGNQVNIPEPGCGFLYGNVNELGDAGEEPWEEFSFLFNSLITLESDYPEIGFNGW